ncbi:hypothetical protein G9464_14930 [Halostella sp. JP-L12]|uniref:DUF7524 family protein n=1 Tax=Halostella TaxID=1843185 RepID=UPI000EF7D648|nr:MULTISPECIES: hypothetical protein [Halostella]NHN48881.1 hypothetical protein [Halostella sp. JP-L12]
MPETLSVHVSDDDLHAISVETPSFETAGAFDVELVNHGRAVHVHLNLMDGLSRAATLEATNHFVETESVRTVRVNVDGPFPAEGKLKIVTAYGAETAYADVTVREPDDADDSVVVDEALASPAGAAETDSNGSSPSSALPTPGAGTTPVLALAGVALLVAFLAATVVEGPIAVVGVGVVLVGVAAAAAILVRD